MQRRLRSLVLLTVVCLAAAYKVSLAQWTGVVAAESPADPTKICREVALTRKPAWTFSGAWTTGDTPELLIVDAIYGTIFRYSSAGESSGPIGEPLKSSLENLLPTIGRSRDSDLILETSDGLMLLDKNLQPSRARQVLYAKTTGGWKIGGLWEWEPAGKDIVAFVDLLKGDPRSPSSWHSASIRFPLEDPSQLTILHEVPLMGQDKVAFRTGYPYIASLGDTSYILSMSDGLALYASQKGSDQLEDLTHLLPGSLETPHFPGFDPHQNYFAQLMAAIEGQSMPVGLYGWDNSLYILSRSPTEQGTRWVLTNVDPTRKKQTSSLELPIRANHVTVIPGPQAWAFIEKGPVKGFGVQDISRALFIPSRLLRAPLKSDGVVCR